LEDTLRFRVSEIRPNRDLNGGSQEWVLGLGKNKFYQIVTQNDQQKVFAEWNYTNLRRWRFDKQTQIYTISLIDSNIEFIISSDDASQISNHFGKLMESSAPRKKESSQTDSKKIGTTGPFSQITEIEVRLPHEKSTTFFAVNGSDTVADICSLISKHLRLETDGRYGLRREAEPAYSFLQSDKALNQQLPSTSDILVFATQYFLPSPVISQHPSYLMFLFEETRMGVTSGDWSFIMLDEVVQLVAKQLQYQEGDYNPKKHTPSFFTFTKLKACLPPVWRSSETIIPEILKAYKVLSGMNQMVAAKYFIETARKLPTYGTTFFYVATDSLELLSVNHKEISQIHPQTQKIIRTWDYHQLEYCLLSKHDVVILKFYNFTLTCNTIDAECIHRLVNGYLRFSTKPSEEPTCLVM